MKATAMNYTREELMLDVGYLVARAERNEDCWGDESRLDTGISSNSIVMIAYGSTRRQEMPYDRDDYAACVRAVRGLPRHRRTAHVLGLLAEAKAAYRRNCPRRRGGRR